MARILAVVVASLAVSVAPLAAASDFADTDYHEVVLFEWDETELDVLVVPPVSPLAPWRLDAINESIQAWAAGIAAIGGWLAGSVALDVYVTGHGGVPPEDHLTDPEIVVLLSMEPGAIGIGIPWDYMVCDSVDPLESGPQKLQDALAQGHGHAGSPWRTALLSTCRDTTENVCFVVNTNWRMYQNGMYDLNAHEFGHCLGIGHVGDAGDFSADASPATDIMSYQEDPSQVHCVSSLNILALQVAFAAVAGQTPPTVEYPAFNPWNAHVEQAPGSYSQVACLNPSAAPLDEFQIDPFNPDALLNPVDAPGAGLGVEALLSPIETPHPYLPNSNLLWTISRPGAKAISLHFEEFSVETSYDWVILKTGGGVTVAVISLEGQASFWSPYVPGSTVLVQFTSDYIIERHGFLVQEIDVLT